MRRIWQLLTLYLIGEEGKIDFEMSEFQRLSVSIPQSFWEGDGCQGVPAQSKVGMQ